MIRNEAEYKAMLEQKRAQVKAEDEAAAKAKEGTIESLRLAVGNSIWEDGISWEERELRFEKFKQLYPQRFPGNAMFMSLKEMQQVEDNN